MWRASPQYCQIVRYAGSLITLFTDLGLWEQVAALYFDYTELDHNLKIRCYVTMDITQHWFLLWICFNRKFRFPTGQNLKKSHVDYHKNMADTLILWMFLLLYLSTNSKVDLISMFVGELPKLQMWQYNSKKKIQVEISQPAVVSVYSSHIRNVDLLDSNTGRFLTKMRSKKWYFLQFGWHNCDQCLGAVLASVCQDRSECNESTGPQNLFCQSLCQLALQSAHRQTMVFWHNWRSNKDIQSLPLPQGMFKLTQMVIWPLWKDKRKTHKQPDHNMQYTHRVMWKM